MSQVIFYKNDAGNIATVIPTPEFVAAIGIDAIAHKDVPAGRPYRIINAAEIPADIANLSHLFDVADADLNTGVGHDYGVGSFWGVVGYGEGVAIVRHAATGEEKEVPL